MLKIASQKSKSLNLKNIHFVEGNAVDLSQFPDHSFDLVLNMDGAISFCGSEAEQAIFESCRVTKKKLIITVSNKILMFPVWLASSLEAVKHFTPADYEMLERGEWHQEQFPENAMMTKGLTQNYFGAF